MSIIPSPWPVVHIPRSFDPTVEDEHGNPARVDALPIVRWVMSVTQYGRRGASMENFDAEYLQRTETTLMVAVANPEAYAHDDHVVVWPQLDVNNNWVPDTGVTYFIDGEPSEERQGPWPALLAIFGGTLKLKRVT